MEGLGLPGHGGVGLEMGEELRGGSQAMGRGA